jgi:hypothetical protein
MATCAGTGCPARSHHGGRSRSRRPSITAQPRPKAPRQRVTPCCPKAGSGCLGPTAQAGSATRAQLGEQPVDAAPLKHGCELRALRDQETDAFDDQVDDHRLPRALAQAPVDAQRLTGRRGHARLHENVALSDRTARDDLEACARLAKVRARVLTQALNERLQHIVAKQTQVFRALPRVGVPPVAPQDQAPEQAEVGAFVQYRVQILIADLFHATLGQQLPDVVDQAPHHFLGGRRRRRGPRQAALQERAEQRENGADQMTTIERSPTRSHGAGPPSTTPRAHRCRTKGVVRRVA